MKVYMTVDMEGSTGICFPEQCQRENPLYVEGKKLQMGDVNAAVQGALDGGATEVLVADMHGGSLHLSPSEIHPEAKLVHGSGALRFPYLDESVEVMFVVAYHAKAGTKWAVLEHTMSSQSIFRQMVNGQEVGELAIDAALAGAVGVPVVLVTGDDKVCAEARELLGDVETATVKYGIGRHRAMCLPPEKTGAIIREAAQRALALKDRIKPLEFESPVEVVTTYKQTHYADGAAAHPRVERVDGFTVRQQYETFAEWYGGTWSQRGK